MANPYVETEQLGSWYEPIARSRREANEIKKGEPVFVVLGNPPYKDKSHGAGGWIERAAPGERAALQDFVPPPEWGVGAHVKHLYNPYVYFWRWAMWKVFDHHDDHDQGVICLITMAGFLDGRGFEGMRDHMRRRSDALWVVDCSPEGHQPAVSTRIFQGVQQPVCIVLAVRDGSTTTDEPAPVHFRALERGSRQAKFDELAGVILNGDGWELCSSTWRAPFLPAAEGRWATFPTLDDLLRWSGSGVMPGRTWVVAPDRVTLRERWDALISAADSEKSELLSEHADRKVSTRLRDGLPGFPANPTSLGEETGAASEPVRLGYRSFDRQWILPDKRVINRPNPTLWSVRGDEQVFLTALQDTPVTSGPAVTFSALIPDLHHYKGSFGGRAFPLWLDADATVPNVVPLLLDHLGQLLDRPVTGPDLFAYVAAIAAHPGYTTTFADDLEQPGLRVPLTAVAVSFDHAVQIGRRILWLHSYGERFVDSAAGRPGQAPRLPKDRAPRVRSGHAIPVDWDGMPDTLDYDPVHEQLHVGAGIVENVTQRMWSYDVSGVNVLTKWFSYRRRDRGRPVMGDRRVSPLMRLQAETWLASYTTELIDLLHVLGLLAEVEPEQAGLLASVLDGPTVTVSELTASGVLPVAGADRKPPGRATPPLRSQLTLDT